MSPLQYQKELSKFDERIAYHKGMAGDYEHKRAVFVLNVLEATSNAEENKEEPKVG